MVEPLPPDAEPLAGDASSRRYHRVRLVDGRTVIRVDYPAGGGDQLERDQRAASWLGRHGLRVPEVVERGPRDEGALLEDFGPDDAAVALSRLPRARRAAAAERLLDPLRCLSALRVESLPSWNAPLDRHRLRWELAGWELWWVVDRGGRPPQPEISRWLDGLAGRVGAHPRRICHRDYHLNNLFFLAAGEIGVIDAQDVLVGPDTYDLASLLGEREMPVLLSEEQRERVATRWAEVTDALPGWRDRLAETSLQRGLKVIGTFARLLASGRGGYQQWLEELVPRVAARAAAAGAPRALSDLLLDC